MRPLIQHLIIGALLAALFPLAIVAGMSALSYQKEIAGVESYVGADSVEAARVAAGVTEFLIGSTRTALNRLADTLAEGPVTQAYLKAEIARLPQIQSLVVLDSAGMIRMSDRGEVSRSLASLEHVQAVMKGAPIAYSNVYDSPSLGVRALAVAIPYRNAKSQGILVARMSTEVMGRLVLSRLGDSKRAATYITDRNGVVIAHPDPAVVASGLSLKTNPPVAAGLQGKTGWAKFDSTLYSSPRVGGYVPLEGPGWVVVSSRETGEAMVSARDRLNTHLTAAAFAALLAMIGAFLWGRRLARPLEQLSNTMLLARDQGLKSAENPLLAPVAVHGSIQEYHTLGTSYNALTAELNRRFQENAAYQEELQAQNEEIFAQSEELQAQNEELAELTEQAQEANRLKSTFLANMSHELRTPLNSIIGYTELVIYNKRIELPEKVRNNLGIVLKNGRHLLGLINDILDLSKVEAGKSTVFAESVDLGSLVQQLVATAEPLATPKGLEIVTEVAPEVSGVVTDEAKLRQIALNLMSNAIKFTPQGRVTLRVAPAGADRWMLEVEDTGLGIAPEHHESVFEEFRQVDDTTTREAGGTGLGLAIARKLARLLGGDLVLARSAPQEGSTFRLILPRRVGPGASEPEPQSAPVLERSLDTRPIPPGRRVVVAIDDDPEMLQLIVEKLKDSPYHVTPASSGDSGLALVRELDPYAVTLDIMMPGVDGWSVLRALKSDPATASIPVVILSFVENKLLGFTLGASAYLTKPVEHTDLVRALNDLRAGVRPGGRVLIVDDDPDARGLYREMLTQAGLDFTEAVDGREAIAAMELERPSLVILDLMMPHMDGFEVAAWLRARPETRDVPVIVVTAKDLTRADVERLTEVQRVIRKGDSNNLLRVEDLRTLLDAAQPREEVL